MSTKTDWLVAALNNVAPNPAAYTTVGTLTTDPSDDDGGRYGGGASDYTVWK